MTTRTVIAIAASVLACGLLASSAAAAKTKHLTRPQASPTTTAPTTTAPTTTGGGGQMPAPQAIPGNNPMGVGQPPAAAPRRGQGSPRPPQ